MPYRLVVIALLKIPYSVIVSSVQFPFVYDVIENGGQEALQVPLKAN